MDKKSIANEWFRRTYGAPTSVQEPAWREIASGKSTLVSAPTGTGKTLAAFLTFISDLDAKAREGMLQNELYVIYVSPLKSLAGDIRENLRRPLDGIAAMEREQGQSSTLKINVAIRTGDTTQSERRRMIKKPPHILITTPESLYLLLTSVSGREMLKTARALIIDELHAIINTKRGAHMMLSAARLDELCPKPLQRIGLSATISPLEAAAEYLSPDGAAIVAPPHNKSTEITVVSPFPESGLLPEGTVWPSIARRVIELCQGVRTAICFCESRLHAEKLAFNIETQSGGADPAQNINAVQGSEASPDGNPENSSAVFRIAVHHGSVSKERRAEVEELLRDGELRLLIATSSMELGIDVGDVELVLQIGKPMGISSALQRLGRAGHRPGETSVMKMIPRTGPEGLYCALTAAAASEGRIERSHPPRLCLDVLAQHLASMAATTEYTIDDALCVLSRAYPFRDVTREDIDGVLKMLAGDYEHARDIPVHPRVIYDRINGIVSGDTYTRLLALSAGGTIPDRGLFKVKSESGVTLGEVDEEFTFEARVGDRFLLGAFAWQIESVSKDTVYVTPTSTTGARPPFWKGDWRGRDMETGVRFGELLRQLGESQEREETLRGLGMDEDSAERANGYIESQLDLTDILPDDRTIIAEHFTDDTGIGQLMIHSVFGRRVNAAIALLARETARANANMDFGVFDDDDGFLLFPYSEGGVPEGLLYDIDLTSAERVLEAVLPETPLFSMAFRYNLARALMTGVKKRGRNPLWVQRLRAAEALDSVINIKNHPIVRETCRECMEDFWDVKNAVAVLEKIRCGDISVREVYTEVPSPFSLPLRRAAENEFMYDYSPTSGGVHASVANARSEELIPPSEARLSELSAPAPPPNSPDALHSRLMIEGEALAGEISAPADWFEKLARQGRVLYIEPGFWIATEHAEEYADALENGDTQARLHLVRRALRYRGGMDAETVATRFFWSDEEASELLTILAAQGDATCDGGIYYHAESYERARRGTVSDRRKAAVTVPPERYADMLLRRRTSAAPVSEQLINSLRQLAGQAFSAEAWEKQILPARVRGYRSDMLDKALASGEVFWSFADGLICFYDTADADFGAEIVLPNVRLRGDSSPCNLTSGDLSQSDMSPDELAITDFLRQRGASFVRSMPNPARGTVSDVLFSLIRRGIIRSDSFAPVRRLNDREPRSPTETKRLAHARANALGGRFELVRPLKTLTVEEKLWRLMENEVILCRETARGFVDWGAALEKLRLWELTGQVRRGYFVRGLGGAQFINDREYEKVTLALGSERRDITWIVATDPAQKWGKTLKHLDGRAFISVAGTAVALCGGLPVAVFERRGEALRLFDGAETEPLLREFAREFSLGAVFPDAKRITVRDYPKDAENALTQAGFTKQMSDFVLYRSAV